MGNLGNTFSCGHAIVYRAKPGMVYDSDFSIAKRGIEKSSDFELKSSGNTGLVVLLDGQVHGPRDLEASQQPESGWEMGWVSLGHTYSCWHAITYQAKPGWVYKLQVLL